MISRRGTENLVGALLLISLVSVLVSGLFYIVSNQFKVEGELSIINCRVYYMGNGNYTVIMDVIAHYAPVKISAVIAYSKGEVVVPAAQEIPEEVGTDEKKTIILVLTEKPDTVIVNYGSFAECDVP